MLRQHTLCIRNKRYFYGKQNSKDTTKQLALNYRTHTFVNPDLCLDSQDWQFFSKSIYITS